MIQALYDSAKVALKAWASQPGVYAALVVGFVIGAIVL